MKGWVVSACVVAVFATQPVNQPLTESAIANEWLDAAAAHQPGVEDAPLRKIRGWNADQIASVLKAIAAAIPREQLNELLERGALLHADITFSHSDPRTPLRVEGWESPSQAQLAKDGEARGHGDLDAHAHFGRAFLSAMRPPLPHQPGDVRNAGPRNRRWAAERRNNPRVRQWFRALSSHFARQHWLADLRPHLDEARRTLDDTPGIMFDTACLSEAIASPQVQHALPPDGRSPQMNRVSVRSQSLDETFNLAEAERYYRDAIKLDPAYAEARVRLARVLSLRGKHADALAVLQARLETGDQIVLYFGALAQGHAAEETQQPELAREAYERAAQLFPRAQSPLLPLMRLARDRADDAAAKSLATTFGQLGSVEKDRFDPWWDYVDCNGRNRSHELDELWSMYRAP